MLEIPRFEDYIDKSLETLIELRQEVIEQILEYENKYILYKKTLDKCETEIIEDPSPEVIYEVSNEKLELLTRIIRFRLKKALDDKTKASSDEKYYFVFVTYDDDPSYREYCYISEDFTIEEGDLVLVDRLGEEVIAEVIDTGYYTYVNAPYPVEKTKHVIKIIKKYEEGEEDEDINNDTTSTVSNDTVANKVDDDNG